MLQPGNSSLTKTTPQVAQLELLFKGPLVKDSIVLTKSALTTLDIKYNYQDKTIWVSDEEANYFLKTGDGSELVHWKKLTARVTIDTYNVLSPYQEDDITYLSGKIYKASQDILAGENPLENADKWLLISGDSITYRFIFENVSEVIVFTDIRNPLFEIITGTIEKVNDATVIGADGLISILNQEIVEAYIRKREDIAPSNGFAYEILFEENMLPKLMSGAINIR